MIVNEAISISVFDDHDRSACLAYLNDEDVQRRTARLPRPYTASDFDQWLAVTRIATEEHDGPVHFAIRDSSEALIGAIGFEDLVKGHRAEIGYWLAKPFWGRGIMTEAVGVACRYAIERWNLVRIAAYVFDFNAASCRVLEKNGFTLEGILHKNRLKDGRFLDSKLYAWVR